MPHALPPINPGCGDCADAITTAVPGPAGANGADGAAGADGVSAYTTTTAPFIMPALAGSVNVAVTNSTWIAYNQILAVGAYAGGTPYAYMQATAKADSTHVTLKNIESATEYTSNVAPGTVFPTGTTICPGGLQGPAGTDGSSGAPTDLHYLTYADDTGTLTNSINLGAAPMATGIVKVTIAAGVASFSTAAAGTDYVAPDAELTALASTTSAADKVPYFNGAGTATTADFRAFGRTLAGCAAAADAATALSLGTMATQAANAVAITGGTITGITDLAKADGGTGVSKLPYFIADRNGVDQLAIASATPTQIAFNREVADSDGCYDTGTQRFTPTVAGLYAFTVAVTVKSLAAAQDIVTVALRRNGTAIAQAFSLAVAATDNVQALLHAVAVANGTTDYFDATVEHDAGVNKDVNGIATLTFFMGHWAG